MLALIGFALVWFTFIGFASLGLSNYICNIHATIQTISSFRDFSLVSYSNNLMLLSLGMSFLATASLNYTFTSERNSFLDLVFRIRYHASETDCLPLSLFMDA